MASTRPGPRRGSATRRGGVRANSATHGVVHPQRRMRLMLLAVMVVLSLFAAQLVRLQGLDAATVSAAAVDGRLREATVPAARGQIVDQQGEVVADSVERKHITGDPIAASEFEGSEEHELPPGVPGVAEAVARVTGEDAQQLLATMQETSGRFTYLVKDVSPQTWQELKALSVPGVHAEDYRKRTYPAGESHAPVLGWLGAGEQPAGGLEMIYDEALTGTPGTRTYEQGGAGEVITTAGQEETPPVPGEDLHLTVDSQLQWYAYDAVKQRVEEAAAESGYAVVTDMEGNVQAMASYPSFDPAESSHTPDELRNAAVEDVYEPGSTGKVMTAAALLEEDLIEADTPITLPSSRLARGGTTFKDAHDPDELHQTFAGVLATSSNMGTILAGEQLKDQKLYDYMRKFGMGETSGLGLPGESPGLIWEPQNWSATTKYTMLFGQGLTSNALQQHGVFQTIANDGVSVTPSIVEGKGEGQDSGDAPSADEGERVISAETAETLTSIMESVPSAEGTAPLAAVDGYRVAGKTSTADRVDPESGKYEGVTAAFVGFAPADDPEYIVSVTIQRPTRISNWGGTIAGPVFSDIMRFALQQNGVQPSDTDSPEVPLVYDPEKQAPDKKSGVTLGDIAISPEDDQ